MNRLSSALREDLLRPRTLAEIAGAFSAGVALSLFFFEWIPLRAGAPPLVGIGFSLSLVLLLQGFTFTHIANAKSRAWQALTCWIRTAICALAAVLAGVFTGAILEIRMALIAAGLSVLYCALWLALWRILALSTGRRRLALQLVFAIALLANSALFWTRSPITAYGTQEHPWGQTLPDAVMKLSPPMTLAAAWHQEATTASKTENARFDIIRAPLTYDVWIGSYQAVPYPALLPSASRPGLPFQAGVLLTLTLWAVPLLFLGEFLAARGKQ